VNLPRFSPFHTFFFFCFSPAWLGAAIQTAASGWNHVNARVLSSNLHLSSCISFRSLMISPPSRTVPLRERRKPAFPWYFPLLLPSLLVLCLPSPPHGSYPVNDVAGPFDFVLIPPLSFYPFFFFFPVSFSPALQYLLLHNAICPGHLTVLDWPRRFVGFFIFFSFFCRLSARCCRICFSTRFSSFLFFFFLFHIPFPLLIAGYRRFRVT